MSPTTTVQPALVPLIFSLFFVMNNFYLLMKFDRRDDRYKYHVQYINLTTASFVQFERLVLCPGQGPFWVWLLKFTIVMIVPYQYRRNVIR